MLKTVWEKYRIYGFGKFFRYIFAELFRFLYWALVRGSYTQEREDLIIDKLLNYKKEAPTLISVPTILTGSAIPRDSISGGGPASISSLIEPAICDSKNTGRRI